MWQELLKAAFLGTENAPLPPVVLEAFRAEGIDTNAEPAEVLLRGAALHWQMQKAGFPLSTFNGEMPAPASAEAQEYCAPQAGIYLELMLNGHHKKALPEFFHYLRQRQWLILPELLPLVFQLALRNKILWNLAQPHIGARGQWLLAQNPDWQILLKRPVEKLEVFEYLGAHKEPETLAYRCFPEQLPEIRDFYEQRSAYRDWQSEHLLKIVTFRVNMLNALNL